MPETTPLCFSVDYPYLPIVLKSCIATVFLVKLILAKACPIRLWCECYLASNWVAGFDHSITDLSAPCKNRLLFPQTHQHLIYLLLSQFSEQAVVFFTMLSFIVTLNIIFLQHRNFHKAHRFPIHWTYRLRSHFLEKPEPLTDDWTTWRASWLAPQKPFDSPNHCPCHNTFYNDMGQWGWCTDSRSAPMVTKQTLKTVMPWKTRIIRVSLRPVDVHHLKILYSSYH